MILILHQGGSHTQYCQVEAATNLGISLLTFGLGHNPGDVPIWMFYPEEIRVLAKLCGLARSKLSCAHTALILPRGEEREDFFLQIEGQFNP
jgi:hypothetical protein